jgi:site-specific DNA-methyltransferase (adenine-specific)
MAGKLPINQIICGDCSKVLPTLPKAKMIFADPPDNLGMKYERFVDNNKAYVFWLNNVVRSAVTVPAKCDIFWLSYYYRYQPYIFEWTKRDWSWRQFIWRFTFGQHNKYDCGNGYRPILRLMRKDAEIYPDAIRIPSARQLKYNDKRANPKGRVPDDVWEFPRVCGTFKERRRWHPNQHPEALIERIVKFSTKEGDLVIDMFAGTGTVNRVCKRLNRRCIGIEISPVYCQKIIEEMETI